MSQPNGSPLNRIRAYTRWPLGRLDRIDAAKVEIAAAMFFHRARYGEIPADIIERANRAMDVLWSEGVPETQWE